eukprot:CAMPEP_0172388684 /NCGR_PEP_ID=MMETSP1061-20121228/5734_1 /TAXON_ID=37318 /ORGANISM="Pseudo-nitzschia pungens, Strain cf. pungens" /LENGTH=80 /DNA_ID=CAMNT_0013118637 /DNA_START=106 /DNA_END=344 /DNA_ORIENTATION=-
MDWDMNQELLAEEETEYTEYSYGEEEGNSYARNSNSNSSNRCRNIRGMLGVGHKRNQTALAGRTPSATRPTITAATATAT